MCHPQAFERRMVKNALNGETSTVKRMEQEEFLRGDSNARVYIKMETSTHVKEVSDETSISMSKPGRIRKTYNVVYMGNITMIKIFI